MGLLVRALVVVGLLRPIVIAVVGDSDRALGLVGFDCSSSPCSGPCCPYMLYIVPSDSSVSPRS